VYLQEVDQLKDKLLKEEHIEKDLLSEVEEKVEDQVAIVKVDEAWSVDKGSTRRVNI